MYDVAEYVSSPRGFDKYELAKMNFIQLEESSIHQLENETIQKLQDRYFVYFVNPQLEQFTTDDKCSFGYEIVGQDDRGRLFVSGDYSTLLKGEPNLPGHNYYFSFALKRDDYGKWDLDMGHILEMSFLRSLYLNRSDKHRDNFKVTIETEAGKREMEIESSKIKNHDWVQEFNAFSSA